MLVFGVVFMPFRYLSVYMILPCSIWRRRSDGPCTIYQLVRDRIQNQNNVIFLESSVDASVWMRRTNEEPYVVPVADKVVRAHARKSFWLLVFVQFLFWWGRARSLMWLLAFVLRMHVCTISVNVLSGRCYSISIYVYDEKTLAAIRWWDHTFTISRSVEWVLWGHDAHAEQPSHLIYT